MSKYSELFKDPKWQRRRLEVLTRDNWTCQYCGEKEKTLNVHHLWYERGKAPWEYSDDCLITLCENCHKEEHDYRREEEYNLLHELKVKKFSAEDLNNLLISFDHIDYPFAVKNFVELIGWMAGDIEKFKLLLAVCKKAKKQRNSPAKKEASRKEKAADI